MPESSPRGSVLWPALGLFVVLWLGLLLAGRSRMLRDPGTFWHTAVGERILATGTLPTVDEYSFTHAGQPWIAHQWLGEVTLALLDRVGGLDAQLLAAVTLLAGLWTWLGVRFLRAGLHWSLAASFLAVGIAASAGHFHVRPHLATMVLFAILIALLIDVEAGRIPFARLWWLVPLFVLWTNCHGGMLGGLATLLLALVGWAVWRRCPWQAVPLWLACAATCLVNPYGVALPQTWLSIVSMPELKQVIQEHAAPDWAGDGLAIALLALVYLALLASTFPARPRVTWLVPLVWMLLSVERVRQAPLFAIAALLALADLFPRTAWARSLAERESDLYRPLAAPAPTAALWGVGLALFVVAVCLPIRYAQLDPERWPVDLLPALREHQHDRPEGTRIVNALNDGGILIRYCPGYRVFIDDRCELYGGRWIADVVLRQTAANFAAWETQYGPCDAVLIATDTEIERTLRADKAHWREGGRAGGRAFYVRVP